MCAAHTGVAVDQPVMDALSTRHLHVNLDQYSGNDLKVFFQILKKAGNFKSIKLALGQTSLDLTMKRKLNRMGTEGPAINNKSNAARLSSMVAKLMRRSPDIASVEAIGIGFSAESVGRIAKATFACPRLKRLSFSQCRIGDRGFSNVSDAIRVSTSIMDLDISDCQLGDKSIGAVTTILKQHNASRNEDRWAYSLRDDPVNVSLNGLLFVDLSNNAVSDRGAAALAAFLPQDNWLQALCLRNNELTDSGIASLLEGLANHDQLFVIDVRNNTLAPPEAISQLEDACAERLLPPRSSHPHLWAVLQRWGWPHMVEKPVLRRRAGRRRRKARSSARATAGHTHGGDDADSGFGPDDNEVNVTEAQLSEWEAQGRTQAQEAIRVAEGGAADEAKGHEQGAGEYDVGEGDWEREAAEPVIPPPAPPTHDRPGSGDVRLTQASPPPVPPPGAYKQVTGGDTTSGRKKRRASSRKRGKSGSKGRGRGRGRASATQRGRGADGTGAGTGEHTQHTTAPPARHGRLRRAESARLHQSAGHDGLVGRGFGRDLDPAAARDWDSDGDVGAAAMELMFESLGPGGGGYGAVGSPQHGTDVEGQVAGLRVALRHSKTALLKAEGERLAVLEENARLRQQVADMEALIKAQAQAAAAVRSSPRRSPTSSESKRREHSRRGKARGGGTSSGRDRSRRRSSGGSKKPHKRAAPQADLDSAVALLAAADTRTATDDMLNKLESTVGRLVKFMANIEQQRDDVGAQPSSARRPRGSKSKHRAKASSKASKHRGSSSSGPLRRTASSKRRRGTTRASTGGGVERGTASPRTSPRRSSHGKVRRSHNSAATNGGSGAAKERASAGGKHRRRGPSKRAGAGTGGSGVGGERGGAPPDAHEELLRLSRAQDELEYAQAAAVVAGGGAAQGSPFHAGPAAGATGNGASDDAGTGGGRGVDQGFDDDDELDLTGFGVTRESQQQAQQARGMAMSSSGLVLRHQEPDSGSDGFDAFDDDGFGDDDDDAQGGVDGTAAGDGRGGAGQQHTQADGTGASIDSDGITEEMMANMQELWN